MDTTAPERLSAENEALRQRIVALEAERAAHELEMAEQRCKLARVERVLAEVPLIVDIFDVGTSRSVFKNRELDALLGYEPGALAAMGPQPMLYKTVHPDDVSRVIAFLEQLRRDAGEMTEAFIDYRVNRGDGAPGWFRSQVRPFERGENARISTVLMVTYDVTETKLAETAWRELYDQLDALVAERTGLLEQANQKLQEEVDTRIKLAADADARARLIRELSSPVIRIWDDIIAMPIIGALDAERAEIIQHALLDAITRTGVRFSIVDLTGVGAMDAETTEHLDRLIRALTLLGAEVVVSGIGSAVARAMVENGLSLKAVTVRNLREALHHCIRQRERLSGKPR